MREDSGKPALVPRDLGVRIPPDEHPDIIPNTSGSVSPNTGGMSVAPNLKALPDFLIPKRLRHLVPSARGSNALLVWSLGNGPFQNGQVSPNLTLRIDQSHRAWLCGTRSRYGVPRVR
jgi:hypothetical protein